MASGEVVSENSLAALCNWNFQQLQYHSVDLEFMFIFVSLFADLTYIKSLIKNYFIINLKEIS